MTPEQMRELADELDMYVGSPTRASYYPSPVLRAADFLRQCAEQEPVAWVWERRYSNGGYSRELVVSEFAARELAKDDGNLPQPDLVYPLYAAPVPPQREPAHDIPLFDFDAEAWKQVLAAARDSKWMPAEYAMNDWLADICQWLRDGPPAGEQRESLSDEQLDAAFRAEPGALLALVSGETTVGAFKTALRRLGRAVERAAYERAAQWVDKRAEDYDAEHGLTDPETGTREYPGNGDEYVFELHEIADGLRALKEPQ